MLQTFTLVWYLKGLCSFLQLLNAKLVLQVVSDEFDCVFIDSGLDVQYKKPNWFLECQKFLYRVSPKIYLTVTLYFEAVTPGNLLEKMMGGQKTMGHCFKIIGYCLYCYFHCF